MKPWLFYVLVGILLIILSCGLQWQAALASSRNRILGSRSMFALFLYTGILVFTAGVFVVMEGVRGFLMTH